MAGANLGKEGDDDDMPELEPVDDAEKKKEEEDDEGEVSDGDLDQKDIEVVMNQVCSLSIILLITTWNA